MDTLLLKGKPVSDALRVNLKSRIDELAVDDIIPKLAAILIGDDPASQVYVRNKGRAFDNLNCRSKTYNLSKDTNENEMRIDTNENEITKISKQKTT